MFEITTWDAVLGGAGLFVTILFILYAFHVGKTMRKQHWKFYSIVLGPIALAVASTILLTDVTWSTATLVALAILIVERVAWSAALKDAAGDDQFVWFIVIFIVPLFGWLLFRGTKVR